jgi:glyoxylase-like metal-dependent hydrolase (beta-lactamase superfamily II)
MRILDHVYLLASGKSGFDWTHPSDCNVYLIDGGKERALIDAGTGESVPQILEHIEALGFAPGGLTHIFLTHLHADHAGGAAGLRAATGAKAAVHAGAARILEEGDESKIDLDTARDAGFYPPDYRFTPCEADVEVRDGDRFEIGTLTVRAMLGPGHSAFDTFYFVETQAGHVSLFTGDALFSGGKISMLNTHDFSLRALAGTVRKLNGERADSLFPPPNTLGPLWDTSTSCWCRRTSYDGRGQAHHRGGHAAPAPCTGAAARLCG